MDLSNVRAKLQTQNFAHYQSFSEFVSDCRLIFDNCAIFNEVSTCCYIRTKFDYHVMLFFYLILISFLPECAFILQWSELLKVAWNSFKDSVSFCLWCVFCTSQSDPACFLLWLHYLLWPLTLGGMLLDKLILLYSWVQLFNMLLILFHRRLLKLEKWVTT